MKRWRIAVLALLVAALIMGISGCSAGIKPDPTPDGENPTETDIVDIIYPEVVADYDELFEANFVPASLPKGFAMPQGNGLVAMDENGRDLYYTGIGRTGIWKASADAQPISMVKMPDAEPKGQVGLLCVYNDILYYHVDGVGIYRLEQDGSAKVVYAGEVLEYCIVNGNVYVISSHDEGICSLSIVSETGENLQEQVFEIGNNGRIMGVSSNRLLLGKKGANGEEYLTFNIDNQRGSVTDEASVKRALSAYQIEGQPLRAISEYTIGFTLITESASDDQTDTPHLVRRTSVQGYSMDAAYVVGTDLYAYASRDEDGNIDGIRVYVIREGGSRMDYMRFSPPEQGEE